MQWVGGFGKLQALAAGNISPAVTGPETGTVTRSRGTGMVVMVRKVAL
ncbi:MAG: hypothetical protein ACWGOX_15240 [Desulforhopalus sp.]